VHGDALDDELHVAQHLVVHVALQVRDLSGCGMTRDNVTKQHDPK
jgi:hypothetical protein